MKSCLTKMQTNMYQQTKILQNIEHITVMKLSI